MKIELVRERHVGSFNHPLRWREKIVRGASWGYCAKNILKVSPAITIRCLTTDVVLISLILTCAKKWITWAPGKHMNRDETMTQLSLFKLTCYEVTRIHKHTRFCNSIWCNFFIISSRFSLAPGFCSITKKTKWRYEHVNLHYCWWIRIMQEAQYAGTRLSTSFPASLIFPFPAIGSM